MKQRGDHKLKSSLRLENLIEVTELKATEINEKHNVCNYSKSIIPSKPAFILTCYHSILVEKRKIVKVAKTGINENSAKVLFALGN